MFLQFPQVIDPGTAALLGAAVGAGSSVIVQIVAAFVTARHETRTFRRALYKETIACVADAYEHALNVFFNMRSGATPDRTTYGKVYAQLSLRGSSDVKLLMDQFQSLLPEDRASFNVEQMVATMRSHIDLLEKARA